MAALYYFSCLRRYFDGINYDNRAVRRARVHFSPNPKNRERKNKKNDINNTEKTKQIIKTNNNDSIKIIIIMIRYCCRYFRCSRDNNVYYDRVVIIIVRVIRPTSSNTLIRTRVRRRYRPRLAGRFLPFALSERPAGDYPEGHHEHEQHGARANGHERLQHEPRVEVDPVEGADAAGRRVREQLAVQQHDPADEVQPEEHGQRQRHVVRHPPRLQFPVFVRQLGLPLEVVLARDRVDRADHQLHRDRGDPLPRHCDSPVVRAVVDHEQLKPIDAIRPRYRRFIPEIKCKSRVIFVVIIYFYQF